MKTPKEIIPKRTEGPQKSEKTSSPTLSEGGASPVNGFYIEELFPSLPDTSYILIGTGRDDFMASRIARAVEDADANLINMNVVGLSDAENNNLVHLRVGHRDPERVARSLERYGYNVLRISGEESSDNSIDELLHYLSI